MVLGNVHCKVRGVDCARARKGQNDEYTVCASELSEVVPLIMIRALGLCYA